MENQNRHRHNIGAVSSSIDRILHVPIGSLSKYSPNELYKLLEGINDDIEAAKRARNWVQSAISMKYEQSIRDRRIDLGKDTGTVHIHDDGFKVTHELAKRVEWNQKELRKVIAQLLTQGANIDDYIITSYKVSERKYKGWASGLQNMFASARTVGIGSSAYKLTKIEDDDSTVGTVEVAYE